MGTFKWPLRIASMDGQRAQEIEATVDTGASFTTMPSNLLRELGIEATGKRGFLLAKGRRVEMDRMGSHEPNWHPEAQRLVPTYMGTSLRKK